MAFRLTGAEYGTEGGIRTHARSLFLQAVFQVETRTWQTLGEKPWKTWRAFCAAWQAPSPVNIPETWPLSPQERREAVRPVTAVPTLRDVHEALLYGEGKEQVCAEELICTVEEWAKFWQIGEQWCVFLIIEQFSLMQRRWPAKPDRLVGRLFELKGDADATVPPFRFPRGWQRTCETRSHYEEAVREALKNYLDAIEKRPLPQDVKPTPTKHDLSHFEWLARYQVKGESFPQIARDVGRHRMAVTDAVKKAADLIGLKLRSPGEPGRPRKH